MFKKLNLLTLLIFLLFGCALPYTSIKGAALALYNLDETEIVVQITEELIENHGTVLISPQPTIVTVEFPIHVTLKPQHAPEFHQKPPSLLFV